MDESKRKILIIIAIVIAIMLLILLLLIGKNASKYDNKVDSENKNIEIINNDAKILHYDGNIYYLNLTNFDGKYDYAISKLPINFEENNLNPKIIHKFSDVKVDTKLHLYKNNIYYSYLQNTYRYDILTDTAKQFCEGILQYIDDEKYVTLYNGNLYECAYFSNNYVTNNIKQLTISKFTMMHKDDERIYYTSPSENGNMLLLAAQKPNFSLTVFDKIDSLTTKIENVSSTSKFVFELLKENDVYKLVRINKETLEKEIFSLEGYSDITLHVEKNVDDIYLYVNEKENTKVLVLGAKDDEIKQYNGEFKEDDVRNYSVAKINNDICLFKNGKELTRIENPLGEKSGIKLNFVIKIEDMLYYEVSINNVNYLSNEEGENISEVKYETILARTSKDGGASFKMNVQ